MPDLSDIAAHWGSVEAAPQLVAARENHVYDMRAGGRRLALRIHRAGYQSRMAIESELRWTARLAEVDFPCPRPVASSDGAYLRAIDGGRYASAVSWIEGQAIGASGTPLQLATGERDALFHAIGALIAALHDATDAVETADLRRPAWDADALLGEEPLWGRFWENPTLSAEEAEFLLRAKARGYETLASYQSADAGLIHADCLQENILTTPTGLALIDFDDAGFGYRGYDLGTALVQHYGHPELPAMENALLAGYGTLRMPPTLEELRFYMALRGLASCGWALSRMAGDTAVLRRYADRAVSLTRAWMG